MKFEIKKEVTESIYLDYNYWKYYDNLIALSEDKMIIYSTQDKYLRIINSGTGIFDHCVQQIVQIGKEVHKKEFIKQLQSFFNEVKESEKFYTETE